MLNKIKSIIDSNSNDEILYKQDQINHRDDFFTKIYWSYAPFTSKYYFEGNPAFLYEYKNLFDMGRFPITLVRDGFLGILDFFLIHPLPKKDYRSILLIPRKFQYLVPKQWVGQVALYEVNLKKTFTQKNKDNLIVVGYPAEETFVNTSIEDKVKELVEISREYKNVEFVLPQRESYLSTSLKQANEKYSLELYKYIYKYFGFEKEIHYDIDKFFIKTKLKNYSFLQLDSDNLFINDNFMDFYLTSQNAFPLHLKENTHKEEALKYDLSLNHEINIFDFDASKSKFNSFYVAYRMNRKTSSIYELFNYDEIREIYKELS